MLCSLEPCRNQTHQLEYICDLHIPKLYVKLVRIQKREKGHDLVLASQSFWVGILALPAELHEGQKHRFCKGQLSLSSLRKRAERCQKQHTTKEMVQSETDDTSPYVIFWFPTIREMDPMVIPTRYTIEKPNVLASRVKDSLNLNPHSSYFWEA